MTQIMREAQQKQLTVMLEWVKGHENMKQKVHNWISKFKMEGNEMADEAAKRAVRLEEEEQGWTTGQGHQVKDNHNRQDE